MDSKGSIYYTNHARLRMAQRAITEIDVRSALEETAVKYPGKTPGTSVAEKTIRGKTLKVIYQEVSGGARIISVMWKGL